MQSLEDGDKPFANNPFYEQVKDDIELLQEAGNDFSEEAILAGELTPVSLVQSFDLTLG